MAISIVSFGNTPQASDDLFLSSATGLDEDSSGVVWLSVMLNDSGGAAKTLYALDDGSSGGTALRPTDLLVQDTARTEALSTDTSRGGARIWITNDGRVGYDAGTLNAEFQQQLQALNPGEFLYDSFTYAIRLGNGTLSWATATIQYAGLNDAPAVTGAVVGNTVEDGEALTLDALANASDVDAGAVLSVVDVPESLPPGVSYDPATHSVTIDPGHAAYQHLPAGAVLPVTVVYGVSDGTATTPASVTFTLTGVNDVAVIGDPANADVTEDAGVDGDGHLQASGTLAITDDDEGEASFQAGATAVGSALGTLALETDGDYTYSVANSAVQSLGANATHVDTFTVTALDGTTKDISFTIHGVNDAAVVGGPANADVTEDAGVDGGGHLQASGTLAITDDDEGEASFQAGATAVGSALGTLALETDGDYTYSVANSAVQSLGANATHVDTFTVTALDGTTKDISFTIHGVNDAAVIGGSSTGSVQEDTNVMDGFLHTAGSLTVSDDDAGEALFQGQASAAGTYGTFTLTAAGAWTYAVSNDLAAVQALDTGGSLTDSFSALSLDGSASQLVTVTIQGLADSNAIVGSDKADTYSFDAAAAGVHTLADPGPGGTDLIRFTGDNLLLSTLNFEKVGSDLVMQVNDQTVTVLNHFAAGTTAVEQVSFATGQSYAGYSLAGTFSLFAGSGFVAGNGSSNDVVAGTSSAETIDGGGGNSGRDLLFGNAGNDTLVGRNAGDLLVGGAGDDVLQGGEGNDVLVGGPGNDTFVFNTVLSAADNVDRIVGFEAGGADALLLSKAVFGGLATTGSTGGTALQASDFLAVANAATASVGSGVHILFDSATGNLYYDSNGGSAAGRTLFATLDPATLSGTVDASDFKVGL
ncbi:VCBS domain-containing protein [Ramlibacter tataouinensis]|uniref:VCBS domain-containing protein n=1 Tax=Ramlibacter tataouinensis TaxID=94132 RepID=UPI0022F3C9FA|nr:VCBS domain-containing protein [Ramlibacter tataouinensis]WBY02421.1 VCBS domain-containing protein [Ramlibacter tataouinensis]